MAGLRLGWRRHARTLTGPDANAIGQTFNELQRFMLWPHVRLKTAADFNVTAGTTSTIAWTSELDDQYDLHAANATEIKPPRGFDSYMAIGVAQGSSNFGGGVGQRSLIWRLNAAALPWRATHHFTASPVGLVVALMHPVTKADVLDVQFTNASAGTDAVGANLTLMFLPLA